MGRDKALLQVGEKTFLDHLIHVLQPAMSPLVIVLGHHADDIERQITFTGVRSAEEIVILKNPDYALGQLSSLKVALRYLVERPVSAAVMALVDHPVITTDVVRLLLNRFREGGAPILIPTYQDRRGHPVLFARRLFQELLDAPLDQGARFIVHRHAAEIELVQTDEEAILWDIDFPADYERLIAKWKSEQQRL